MFNCVFGWFECSLSNSMCAPVNGYNQRRFQIAAEWASLYGIFYKLTY